MSRRRVVRTYVDQDLREAWELRFGDYASLSWVLETAMRSTLELTAGNPTFAELVKQSIKAHVTHIKHLPRLPDDTRPTSTT